MMTREQLQQTTIGDEFLTGGFVITVDAALDHLEMMMRYRTEYLDNPVWIAKYDLEIEATKEILKIITK